MKQKYYEPFQLDWDRRQERGKSSRRNRLWNMLKQQFSDSSQASPLPNHQNWKVEKNHRLKVEETRSKAIMHYYRTGHR